MPVTPYIPRYDFPDIKILINGIDTGLNTLLKKADIRYELNKIPYAKLRFISSNPDLTGKEKKLASDFIAVTDEIEIKITDDKEKTLFKGIVFKLEKNVESTSGFETKIECKDKCVNLIAQQEVIADETFEDKMTRFLNTYKIEKKLDLKTWGSKIVSKTSNISPWDYILGFLDVLGLMTIIRGGVFSVFESTNDVAEATYLASNGVNVFEFEASEDQPVSKVIIQSWNPETQTVDLLEEETKAANGEGTEVIDLSQSNYSTETINQMLKARAAKNRLASVKGKVRTFGNLSAQYGEHISFEKVNDKIDGTSLIISTEHHTLENGCWNTEYNFGLENNNSFTENIKSSSTTNEERLGQTNTMRGLQIGVVTKIEDDPRNQFRIKVKIPSISDKGEGVWARLSSMQAGDNRGAFFIPEVDDEVVLGCFNNNPDTPVILGKLFSSAHAMPFTISKENYIQGMVSKEGTKIIIDDEKKSVEISTKKGNKLLISDDEKGFVLEDENKNKLMLNDKGITLESKKDIILKANGNIKIEGVENSLKASGNMKLNGALIQLN